MIMKKGHHKKLAILIICTFSISCMEVFAQKCLNVVSLDKYGFQLELKKSPDRIKEKLNSKTYLLIDVTNCFGSICIGEYDFKNRLLFQGCYYGKDTLYKAKGNFIIDEVTLKDSIGEIKYFKPVRDGNWKYYDTLGIILKTEIYKKGVLIN
jgi:hypothetical protein